MGQSEHWFPQQPKHFDQCQSGETQHHRHSELVLRDQEAGYLHKSICETEIENMEHGAVSAPKTKTGIDKPTNGCLRVHSNG